MQVSLGLHVGRRPITVGSVGLVNYPDLPRSGLPGPRLLRSGSSERPKVSRDHERRVAPFERLLVSASELASDVDTEVPDSAGDFPSQAVRSVPLLPVGHSATTAGARFLSRLNTGGGMASIVLSLSTAGVLNVAETVFASRAGAVSPPYSAPSGRSVEEGGLAPLPQKLRRPLPTGQTEPCSRVFWGSWASRTS